jgi:hypothetical protein
MDANYPGVLAKIEERKQLDEDLRSDMRAALDAFKEQFRALACRTSAVAG